MKHDMRATGNSKSSRLEYLKFQSLQNDGKRAIHNGLALTRESKFSIPRPAEKVVE
jgi:hypothetical protein